VLEFLIGKLIGRAVVGLFMPGRRRALRSRRRSRLPIADAAQEQVTDVAQAARVFHWLIHHSPRSVRSFNLDNIVQFSELIHFDVLVVWIGDPFAIDDQAVAIAARIERQGHAELAGALAGGHDVGIR
jgi:hypothetical protein